MRIYVIDPWKRHWWESADYWRDQGHDVGIGPYWGPSIMEGQDAVIFHAVQDNLKKASHKSEKPPNTVIIAEAVDVDIYAGHLGAVDWSYVDHLVFMAHHMQEIAAKKYKKKIADVPQTVIPGGIDVSKWTPRRQPSTGHNVAWIGRLWIPKDVFGALMVFNDLIIRQPDKPWKLFILSDDKWHPPWYRNHTMAYVEANPQLERHITWVSRVPDVNVWLDDKDYLLQTSQKEAYGYVIAQAAAKGICPIIRNTNGALDIWPREWVFDTHDEAITMFGPYHPMWNRQWIEDNYPISKRMESFNKIIAQYR